MQVLYHGKRLEVAGGEKLEKIRLQQNSAF